MKRDPVELTYCDATKEFMSFSLPYVLSRVLLAAPWLFDGIVMKKLGHEEVLAAPTITSIKACSMGASGAFMLTMGFVGGLKIGKGDRLQTQDRSESAMELYTEAGRISRQTWMLAVPLSTVLGGTLFFISPILLGLHPSMSLEMAQKIEQYYRGFVWSILPTLWMMSDNQLLVAVKKPWVALLSTSCNVIMTLAISYSLALCTDLGIEGLGIGSTISALVTVGLLRLYYYYDQSFKKFGLFDFREPDRNKDLCEIISEGGKVSFFSLSEWGNIAALTAFSTYMETNSMLAVQASLQLVVPYSFAILAFSRAAGTLIARNRGDREIAISNQNEEHRVICEKNIRKFGTIHICTAATLGIVVGTVIASFAEEFSGLFTHKKSSEITLTVQVSCLGLVFDSIRIAAAGNLRGLKDTCFPPIVSVALMSAVGLTISGLMIFQDDKDSAVWLFIPRAVTLATVALLMIGRWHNKSYVKSCEDPLLFSAAPGESLEAMLDTLETPLIENNRSS